jgi:hypothetical protein
VMLPAEDFFYFDRKRAISGEECLVREYEGLKRDVVELASSERKF